MASILEPLASPDAGAGAAHDVNLTAREIDVLRLMAEGLTAASVGRRLGCSARTVHKHIENMYRKLGVGDRVSAVREGQRRSLVAH